MKDIVKRKIWDVFPIKPFKSKYFKALLIAVKDCDIDSINSIVALDPYVVYSFDENKKTALHHAIYFQNYRVVLCLLSNKADPNMEDCFGWPCLAHAIMVENLYIM